MSLEAQFGLVNSLTKLSEKRLRFEPIQPDKALIRFPNNDNKWHQTHYSTSAPKFADLEPELWLVPAQINQRFLASTRVALQNSQTAKLKHWDKLAHLSCDSGEMIVKLNFSEPFRGVVYPDHNRLSPCRFFGDGHLNYELRLPLRGCGTRQLAPRVFVNEVVVRFHRSLELEEDEAKTLICRYLAPNSTYVTQQQQAGAGSSEEQYEFVGQSRRPAVGNQVIRFGSNGEPGGSALETLSEQLLVAPSLGPQPDLSQQDRLAKLTQPSLPLSLPPPLLNRSKSSIGGGGFLSSSSQQQQSSSIALLLLISSIMFLVLLAFALATGLYYLRNRRGQQLRRRQRLASALIANSNTPQPVSSISGSNTHRPAPQLVNQQVKTRQTAAEILKRKGRHLQNPMVQLAALKERQQQQWQDEPIKEANLAQYVIPMQQNHVWYKSEANLPNGTPIVGGRMSRWRPSLSLEQTAAGGRRERAARPANKQLPLPSGVPVEGRRRQQPFSSGGKPLLLSHKQRRNFDSLGRRNLQERQLNLRPQKVNLQPATSFKATPRLEPQSAQSGPQTYLFEGHSPRFRPGTRSASSMSGSDSLETEQSALPRLQLKSIEDAYISRYTETKRQEFKSRDSRRPLAIAEWRKAVSEANKQQPPEVSEDDQPKQSEGDRKQLGGTKLRSLSEIDISFVREPPEQDDEATTRTRILHVGDTKSQVEVLPERKSAQSPDLVVSSEYPISLEQPPTPNKQQSDFGPKGQTQVLARASSADSVSYV